VQNDVLLLIHFLLALHFDIDTPQILPALVNYGRTNTFGRALSLAHCSHCQLLYIHLILERGDGAVFYYQQHYHDPRKIGKP
jgi:hypothetical protein